MSHSHEDVHQHNHEGHSTRLGNHGHAPASLETGGKHAEPKHFSLMLACSEICRTAAHFMVLNSPHHKRLCRECAEICTECAKDCERVGDMDDCVQACKSCAASRRAMASQVSTRGAERTIERSGSYLLSLKRSRQRQGE